MKTLRRLTLKNVSDVELTNSEQKMLMGGGYGDTEICSFICQCIHREGPPRLINAPCNDAPWDRDTSCSTGYQNCTKQKEYIDGLTYA